MSILGTRVVRIEDPRLLTAGGTYVDDLRVPQLTGAARVTFVRSHHGHALITGVDASAALAAPGVIAVLTYQDINDIPPPPPLPEGGPPPGSEAAPLPMGGVWQEPLLAVDRVRFVGEPVAMVLTDDSYQGEDAAELVSVDYEPLPAIVDPADALAGHTLLFPDAGSNVAVAHPAGDTAFEGCDVVVSRDIVNQRVAPVPMEGRAAAAMWVDGKLTVWVSTQNAQISRFIMAGAFGLDPGAIRVVAPDVGGGFGAKVGIDRDAILVAWAARHTGRPLRWVETRSENLVGMTHGRAQQHSIKIGGTRDGRVLAYRLDVVQDTGAYPRMSGFLPTLTNLMAVGPYDIAHVEVGYRVVVTNTTPIAAYRGAGPPGGHRRDRAGDGPVRGRDRHGPGGGAAARTSCRPTSSRTRPRAGPTTTAATTSGRWTRCWPARATRACGPSRPAAGSAGTCSSSASGWPATWRSPRRTPTTARPPGWWSTTTARPRSTPAAPRTARATTRHGRCWSSRIWGSPWTRSRCSTATPT